MPAFSSPIDCTPWVTGGLWPAELSTVTAETATLADYLRTDLQRIANSANDELKIIRRAGMDGLARQAQEARVIEEARARAVRRVESTIRQLRAVKAGAAEARSRGQAVGPDLDATQVIPAVTDAEPAVDAAPASEPKPRREAAEAGRHHAVAVGPFAGNDEPEEPAATAPGLDDTQVIPDVTAEPQPAREVPTESDHQSEVAPEPAAALPPAPGDHAARPGTQEATAATGSDIDRLLEFVVRQEPRLNWAVGEQLDGTTVLVTDLGHGWIPSGINLPAGVRLLEPRRRSGKPSALIGDAKRVATYAPGDSLRRSADFAATRSSLEPRELPAIDDLGRVLSEATRRREGLPRVMHAMIKAAAVGTRVVEQEIDVLRVHLDTARYQLLVQYPNADPELLLNCLLMAAAEAMLTGDSISANYHLAWFTKLAAPSADR